MSVLTQRVILQENVPITQAKKQLKLSITKELIKTYHEPFLGPA